MFAFVFVGPVSMHNVYNLIHIQRYKSHGTIYFESICLTEI